MADENQVDVQIKLGADINGGIQTEAEFERLKKKSKEFGDESAKSSKQAVSGMAGFEKSIGFVRKALTGFGVAGLFTALIGGIQKVSESFSAAKTKADELAEATGKKALAKSIDDLAESYAKMKENLTAAATAQQNQLDLIDMEVKSRRDLQAAKLDAAEQEELAGVDANAADAEEQKKVIQAKYAHMRGTNAASDKLEDLVLQRQKYGKTAEIKDKEAAAAEAEANGYAAQARRLRGMANMEGISATEANEKDKTGGVGRYIVGTINDIFSGNWGNLASHTSAEGDAEREKHKARQDELEKKAEELEKKAEASRNDAEAKRKEADHNRNLATAMNGSVEAAQIAQGTTQVKESLAERDAASSLSKKQAEEARKAKELADAKALLASGEGQAAQYRSQIAANNQQITDTSYQVATGKMGSNAGSKAVTELQERNRELNELLQNLLHEIEQSKQVIKKANEQARNSRGVDSTEGA